MSYGAQGEAPPCALLRSPPLFFYMFVGCVRHGVRQEVVKQPPWIHRFVPPTILRPFLCVAGFFFFLSIFVGRRPSPLGDRLTDCLTVCLTDSTSLRLLYG